MEQSRFKKEKRFKFLVNNDGVFRIITMFYVMKNYMAEYCREIGCKPYEKNDVIYIILKDLHNWSTSHLIIHGGKNYRIPISEGIIAFTALQIKKFLLFKISLMKLIGF